FEVPDRKGARQPLHVTVIRYNDELHKRDQLVCQTLTLRLRRKDRDAPPPGKPAGPPRANESSADQGLDVETAHAVGTGKEVVLTSDAESLVAQGNDF